MIEVALAVAAFAVLAGWVWWYDARGVGEWEDLVSPAAADAHALLSRKFRAEERAGLLAAIVPDRLQLLDRMMLFSRLAEAVTDRSGSRERIAELRLAFLTLAEGLPDGALGRLRALDEETLETFHMLLTSMAAERR